MQQDDTTVRNAEMVLAFYDSSDPARRIATLADALKAGAGRVSIVGWPQLIADLNAALSPADGATGVVGPDLGEPETRRVSALLAQYLSPGQAFCDHGSSYICVEVGEELATGQIEVRCHSIVAYRNALQARSLP